MRIIGLGIGDVTESILTRSVDSLVLTFAGIEGDRHAGLNAKATMRQKYVPRGALIKNSRQLSMVSVEELTLTALALSESQVLDWRAYGANVCFDDASALTRVAPGTRLIFESGAIVVVDGAHDPCVKTGRAISAQLGRNVISAFVKAAMHCRGLVGWVERPGLLRVGDTPRELAR